MHTLDVTIYRCTILELLLSRSLHVTATYKIVTAATASATDFRMYEAIYRCVYTEACSNSIRVYASFMAVDYVLTRKEL